MTAFKRILIGIDNSKFAEHAAQVGFNLAKTFNAKVGLVHVVEPTYVASPVTDTTLGIPLEAGTSLATMEVMDAQNMLSDSIIDRTIKTYAGDLDVTHFTDYGSTAEGIVNCSKEFKADLIVIGTHSRTGLDRIFMGSVAEHVVRHADMPVLVVPLNESE